MIISYFVKEVRVLIKRRQWLDYWNHQIFSFFWNRHDMYSKVFDVICNVVDWLKNISVFETT